MANPKFIFEIVEEKLVSRKRVFEVQAENEANALLKIQDEISKNAHQVGYTAEQEGSYIEVSAPTVVIEYSPV